MEKLLKNLLTFLVLVLPVFVAAQSGTVRGQLIDDANGETIPFANVIIQETGNGFSTDLDGKFSIDLPIGIYNFKVSYIGYAELTISDIEVTDGKVSVLDMRLKEESEVIDQIVVTATALRNTETALMTIQKKSANVLDGISSQTFKRIGDSNAASAIKRVTGVSIEGGKYVFVRGLGDRYTKSILNGMDIPGLDPDRNTLQMDIFPTNLIDNIMVMKSFTPDLPGDFTGGVVNIVTKDFPDQKTFNVSAGLSYNPSMHFNKDYLSYEGSGTDWLGFDDGTRDIPFQAERDIPSPINDPTLTALTSSFSKTMATQKMRSFADYNFSLSTGNQINTPKLNIGYNLALNYRSDTDFYEDAEYNIFIKPVATDDFELQTDRQQTGSVGSNTRLWSAMAGTAFKYNNHKVNINLLHIQSGKSSAGLFNTQTFIRNSNTIIKDNLEYTQSGISNLLVSGKHMFDESDFTVDWKFSPTISRIADKDIRVTPFREDDGELSFEPSEGAQPQRLFRNLDEINYSSALDFTKGLVIGKRAANLKWGFRSTMKQRDYEIFAYRFNVKSQSQVDFMGDPDRLLAEENIWTYQTGVGTYVQGNYEPANTYMAKQNTMAGYIMNELPISDRLKAIYGVRVEKFEHFYTGQNNSGDIVYDNEKIIDNIDVLPSVNMIYSLVEDMNLRMSYSKTLARPSFKEASIAQIYDPISQLTFIGNIDLEQTQINNFDVRWELYQPGGQMFAVSGFYKMFTNPIEIVSFSQSAPDNFQPRNVGDATVMGVELEVRKDLSFIAEGMRSLNFGTNLTIVQSEVAMDKSPNGEFDSRVKNAREGEQIADTRQMQGQAPFIINSYLNYRKPGGIWEANLSYNVQGESLAIVGIGLNPDIYQASFHSLNFKASFNIGPEGRTRISAGVNNILGDDRLKLYQSFNAADQIFERFVPDRTYSVGVSYDFE